MDMKEFSSKDNAKFNFLGKRARGPQECIFQAFRELKIQNFENSWRHLQHILGLLQASCFELHGN